MTAPSKTSHVGKSGEANGWDHGSNPDFYNYYAAESQSDSTRRRFLGIQAAVLRIAAQTGLIGQLDVVDIGCGAGTQSRAISEGLDIR
jgi:hypothetical protein